MDQGREWYLMLFAQEQLSHLRYNNNRAPHLQTTSKLVCVCVCMCVCMCVCVCVCVCVWVGGWVGVSVGMCVLKVTIHF